MENSAKLVTAISALIGVLAWPIIVAIIGLYFRKDIKAIAIKVPPLIDRMKSLKLLGFEAELSALADKSDSSGEQKGEVTADQAHVSATIKVKADEIGKDRLISELDRLTIEYDTVRRAMQSGGERTRQMTRIVVQMRGLSQSVSDLIDVYKSSGSAGSRLAAVAMMQMEPAKADLEWLKERFCIEYPFIFYHAALALQNVVNFRQGEARQVAIMAASEALAQVRSFGGAPDRETVLVLESVTQQGAGGA